jgi:hypothetical protein
MVRGLRTGKPFLMSDRTPASLDTASRTLVLRHVGAMIARVQAYFAQHQDVHLQRMRAHFFEMVDNRPNTTQAQNLRTVGVMLDKQAVLFNRALQAALRESIEDEVEAVIPGALSVLRPAADSDNSSGPSSMALLDVDEIERHLLVDRVAQKFNGRYDTQLKPLTVSVGALLRQEDFTLVDNPFRPASLLRAFLMAWHSSAFDPAAAEDFVSAIEPDCSIDWAPLYSDLAAMLVRAGYSAKLVHRIKRTASGDSAAAPLYTEAGPGAAGTGPAAPGVPATGGGAGAFGAGRGGAAGGVAGEPGGVQAVARGIADRARQFLQKLGFGAPGSAGDGDGGSGFGGGGGGGEGGAGSGGGSMKAPADAALMGFLGGLQAGAGSSQFPEWARGQDIAGQNVLRQMREREEVQRAPELDRGTVDALAEVFDYVFADKAIPLQLKYVIGRLQIPVLKAAIIDRDFFLSSEHPARRLVDSLAAAAVGWTLEMGEADPLYRCIDATAKRVLTEFDDDLELFRTCLTDFDALLQAHAQRAEVQIKPAATQEQFKEAREGALAHADGVVHQCIHALPIEEPLEPFLLPFMTHQWREVLANAWQQAETDPASWHEAVRVMDQVIWSTRPKPLPDERGRLMALLPDLVRQLDTSLDAIGWKGEERDLFTRRLIATHMRAIRTPKAGSPAPVDSGPGELETQAGRAAIKELDKRLAPETLAAPDQFDAMAHGLERGMWFDFEHDADLLRRYRLSWISPQRSRMLFTNRDGFEAFVRSQREVAALLREGRLIIIDQQPIVKRAIDQIMADEEAQPERLELQLE